MAGLKREIEYNLNLQDMLICELNATVYGDILGSNKLKQPELPDLK